MARAPLRIAAGAAPSNAAPPDLNDPGLYINRELSWLDFNQRVLNQARDDTHPLLERVKFLAIASSNLDEFFMVRVASLLRKLRAGAVDRTSIDGIDVAGAAGGDPPAAAGMLKDSTACWKTHLRPALAEEGVRFLNPSDYGCDPALPGRVFPFGDLFAADAAGLRPGHPFPFISIAARTSR